jgi:hypothetical protein
MLLLREIMPSGKLSNLQMELLKIFNRDLPDEQVLEIRSLLAEYFLNKADEELERLEKEKGWTAETYEQWANEHWRRKTIQ